MDLENIDEIVLRNKIKSYKSGSGNGFFDDREVMFLTLFIFFLYGSVFYFFWGSFGILISIGSFFWYLIHIHNEEENRKYVLEDLEYQLRNLLHEKELKAIVSGEKKTDLSKEEFKEIERELSAIKLDKYNNYRQ